MQEGGDSDGVSFEIKKEEHRQLLLTELITIMRADKAEGRLQTIPTYKVIASEICSSEKIINHLKHEDFVVLKNKISSE